MKYVVSTLVGFLISTLVIAGLEPRPVYDPIIAAKPFGDVAVKSPETLTADQQKQKEEIGQKFRMCGITDLPDGTRKIAFIDETSGTLASYLLGEGETQNGFELVAADYDHEMATLRKDGLVFTLGLGKGLLEPEQVAAILKTAETLPAEMIAKPARPVPQGGAVQNSPKGSFKARLLQRRAEKEAAENSAVKAQEQKLQQEARRIQIDRIKQGLEPTEPITLTAEEDAELEAAGAFNKKTKEEPAQENDAQ